MITIYVDNSIKIKNYKEAYSFFKSFCESNLTLRNPDYYIAQKLGKNTNYMQEYLKLYSFNNDILIIPFGMYFNLYKHITLNNIKCEWVNLIPKITPSTLYFKEVYDNLYDYQKNAVKELISVKNGILIAPCGSGKTQMGLAYASMLNGRTLRLTHTKELLNQSRKRASILFHRKENEFGEITEGLINIKDTITFATVQTLSKCDLSNFKNSFDVIIVDECHHCVGTPTHIKQFSKIVSSLSARYKIGLTATPYRSDGLIPAMYTLLGTSIIEINKKSIGSKIFKSIKIDRKIDLTYNFKEYIGTDGRVNYTNLINMLSFDERRNNIIAKDACEILKEKRKLLILVDRVEHTSILNKLILTINPDIKTKIIVGIVKNRNINIDDFDVLIATSQLAKEGLDIPKLDTLFLILPYKNKAMVEQAKGRIERNFEGKKQPIVYDYIDINIDYCVQNAKLRNRIYKKS